MPKRRTMRIGVIAVGVRPEVEGDVDCHAHASLV